MRKGYKQPSKAQMAQIEEKKRIQQMATPPPTGGSLQNVVTQLYILVFAHDTKRLERVLTPQEFNVFVSTADMKPSELASSFFIMPMPMMEGVLPKLLEWMKEGASGKLEAIEVPEEAHTSGDECLSSSSCSSSMSALSIEEASTE